MIKVLNIMSTSFHEVRRQGVFTRSEENAKKITQAQEH